MALTKYKIGQLIKIVDERNIYGIKSFYGININKEFMPTVANTEGLDESNYKVVRKNRFVFSGMQTGRDECIRISMYLEKDPIIVSPAYITFEVETTNIVLPAYFFMIFLSKEKDRLGWFYSDGSVRSNLDWDRFCDMELDLPDILTQQKYVDIYKAMVANQQSYARGLEDLKLTLDAYVEYARKTNRTTAGRKFLLGDLIEQRREKYDGTKMPIRGVSKEGFVEPRQPDADLNLYNQYYYNDFVFNPARMELNSIQLNSYFEKACCSSLYEVFHVKRLDVVMPEYLNLLLKRSEFARWCEYVGWGSAREYCRVDTISQYPIVVPSMDEQKAVAGIYKAYMLRKQINEQLKAQIKDICPVLIRGSLEDGGEPNGKTA